MFNCVAKSCQSEMVLLYMRCQAVEVLDIEQKNKNKEFVISLDSDALPEDVVQEAFMCPDSGWSLFLNLSIVGLCFCQGP